MRRNITVSLDEQVIRQAKVAAARRGMSLSALLREKLSELAAEDERYETARRDVLELMATGPFVGPGELPSREEMYERRALR